MAGNGGMVSFYRVFYMDSSGAICLWTDRRLHPAPPNREEEGKEFLIVSVSSQLPSAQNSSYVIVAYFCCGIFRTSSHSFKKYSSSIFYVPETVCKYLGLYGVYGVCILAE